MKIARISPRVTSSTLLVGAAALLLVSTACEKEATAPQKVAASNVTAPVSAANVAAVSGKTFAFTNGAALGNAYNNKPVSITLNATGSSTTAAIVSTTGTVSANVTFGSCTFTVTASTDPAVPVGTIITVATCNLTVNTAGVPATGQTTQANATFTIGNTTSAPAPVTVTVATNGTVTVTTPSGTPVTVGTTTTTNATGLGG